MLKGDKGFPNVTTMFFITRSLALLCLSSWWYFISEWVGFFLLVICEKRMSCTSLIKGDYYVTSVRLTCTIWALGHLL